MNLYKKYLEKTAAWKLDPDYRAARVQHRAGRVWAAGKLTSDLGKKMTSRISDYMSAYLAGRHKNQSMSVGKNNVQRATTSVFSNPGARAKNLKVRSYSEQSPVAHNILRFKDKRAE